jgi:hypothetical protein
MKMTVQHYAPIPFLQREVIPLPTISVAHCVIPRAAVVALSPAKSLELCSSFFVMSVAQLRRVLNCAAKAVSRLSFYIKVIGYFSVTTTQVTLIKSASEAPQSHYQ